MRGELTIVGQGLAGTCLAWRLWSRGKGFRLLHPGDGQGSSAISAGLLTPVTSAARAKGRRLEEVLSESLSTAAVSIAIPANTCSAASGQEDPLFWTAVQALLSGVRHPASCTPQPEAATITDEVVGMVEPERCEGYSGLVTGMGQVKRMRSARCGMCPGCKCGDCGQCKNCLDKPAFGGPGCRKQACMMRTCSMPWLVDDKDSSSASPANFT